MKILLMTNYPLVDNKKWKKDLISSLCDNYEVFVLFGKKSIWSHLQAYLRRKYNTDIKKRYYRGTTEDNIRTVSFLKYNGIKYFKTSNVNSDKAIEIINRIKPDFGIVALDQILSKRVIEIVPLVLNAHFGNLPCIKGWNATEWSMLVDRRVDVCLHKVDYKVDNGPIYLKESINVERGDDFEDLRFKCQELALALYIKFFANPEYFIENSIPNKGGKTYYLINNKLKEIAQDVLKKYA
ncbi:MAG: hypothetical protein GF353_25530 [Candidatus Lokiarchaeota archaeon]|nr:hypothetical protein [Candidatus Lokiarchaeota archaeon]